MPRNEPSFAPVFDDAHSDRKGGGAFIYVLMAVVLVAFGGFVWNLYGGHAPEHIAAQPGAYKVAPEQDQAVTDPSDENAMYNSLDGTEDTAAPAPGANSTQTANTDAPAATPAPAVQTGAPRVGATPAFAANGAYVAQIAALQSEAAVQPAWSRMSSRAPQLFGAAHLDVLRADLGQRGIYFRVRAGYFADRANANLFCDRIKQMGQDCIVVAR